MITDLINFAKDPHKNHRTLCHWCKISSNVILSLVHSLTLSMDWTYFAKDPHQSQKTLSSNDVKFRVTSLWVWFIPWPYPWSGLILSDNHIVDRWLENWWTSRMRSGVMWAWQSGFALQVTSCCLPWRKGCLQGSRRKNLDEWFLKKNFQWGTVLMQSTPSAVARGGEAWRRNVRWP